MKKFLQICIGISLIIATIYTCVVFTVYLEYKNQKPIEYSEIYEKFLQKSLADKDLSEQEIFKRDGWDFFPIEILMEDQENLLRLSTYLDLEKFVKSTENIASVRFSDSFQKENTYTSEQVSRIISIFADYWKFWKNFRIEGKLQSEIFENNEILDKIVLLPVKNLQIFSYGNGKIQFTEEQLEKMKNSPISLFDIANYDGCELGWEFSNNEIIYVNKIPKIFCYLQNDIVLPFLFHSDANGEKIINPDYLAEIYKKIRETENQNLKWNEEKIWFEDFEKLNFDSEKNISILLSEGHSRELIIAILDRISRENFEHIFLEFSFETLDYEILELLSRLDAQKISLSLIEAYNWRIPKFVIPENFVKIFEEKFEFLGIITSTGMGWISEIFFEKNWKEEKNIDEKMFSVTALWQYENFESEQNKNFSEKFYIKNPQK